jgi:transcriptional regulator with XRE-family HTH domain
MAVNPAVRLARRLRSLREQGLTGRKITQADLGKALGASGPLISSWENQTKPTSPPQERLDAYATFFATERSIEQSPFRVLPKSQLTPAELARREELLQELTNLRNGAQRDEPGPTAADPFAGSHWRFPVDQDITIVCSVLPPEDRRPALYTNPDAPDYVELFKYADLDALIELHGHLRAANPLNNVYIRAPEDLRADDYTSHLVLLGGVDVNPTTEELLRLLDLPVKQLARVDLNDPGGFLVGKDQRRLKPKLRTVDDKQVLVQDVTHFFRSPSPLNDKRTVTICCGMYARGTLGAVRALTDARFRDRNDNYLRTRFAGKNTFSVISRVMVVLGETVTPDWTSSEDLLDEWPVPAE